MNTALSWIKAYVPDLDVTAREYTDAMTLTGTKVEGYTCLDKNLEKIVVGEVLSVERHPDANKLVDALRLKGDPLLGALLLVNVDHASYDLSGSQLLDQLAGAVYGLLCGIGVKALLILAGGIGTKAQLLCGKADIGAVKAGGLKYHGAHIVCDL